MAYYVDAAAHDLSHAGTGRNARSLLGASHEGSRHGGHEMQVSKRVKKDAM